MSAKREQLDFDYCEHGVPEASEEGIAPCGELATARWKWGDGEWLYVCEEHDEILMEEEHDNMISIKGNSGVT